ncbi:MAG: RHS repeat-associated core domain-containing protein [Cyclobacteriaceae bacterium]
MIRFITRIFRAIFNFFRQLFGLSPTPVPPTPISNQPPTINILNPVSDVVGDRVLIQYKLLDAESDPANLFVTFRIAGGANQPATPDIQDPRHSGSTGLNTSPGGNTYQFVWNWRQDIVQDPVDNVVINLQGEDAYQSGPIVSSAAIRISTSGSPTPGLPRIMIQSPTSDVIAHEVDIEYLAMDQNSDLLDIVVEYSIAGGPRIPATAKTSDPRNNGVSNLPSSPLGIVYHFIWDWFADVNLNQVNDVKLYIRAVDSSGSGQWTSSPSFNISQPASPTYQVLIHSPSGGTVTSYPVPIEFSLLDPTSTSADVVIKYSTDNGVSLIDATPDVGSPSMINLNSSPQGHPHTFLWDIMADLGNPVANGLLIYVEATYNQNTVRQTSQHFDLDVNIPPMVDIWQPSGGITAAPVRVDFVLSDRNSNNVDLIPEFQLPGGQYQSATLHHTSPGIQGLPTDPFGLNYFLLWDADNDLGGAGGTDISFRIRASDGVSEGSDISSLFDVGSPLPMVKIVSPKGGSHGTPVPVLFRVSDPVHTTIQGEVKFSIDQGITFDDATPAPGRGSEDLSSLTASPNLESHFFVWDAVADLSAIPQNDILLQIKVISPLGSTTVRSLPFDISALIPGAPIIPPITPNSSRPEVRDVFNGGTFRQSQVPVRFTLSDAEMKPTSVLVEYDAGSGFTPATPSPISDTMVGLAAPDVIMDHRFVWDALGDLGIMSQEENIPIRLTPYVGSKTGAPITKTFKVKTEPKPSIPPVETVRDLSGLVMTIEHGNNQNGVGGMLMPEMLKVKVEGPDPQGQLVPLPGVRVSFRPLAPSTLDVSIEEHGALATTTDYNGIAGVTVRTSVVNTLQNFQIKASVVGVTAANQTFDLKVDVPEIAQDVNNPADLTIGDSSLFHFFLDTDQDTTTTRHFMAEKGDPLFFRIQASNAVIDNPFPKVPEAHGTTLRSADNLASVNVLPVDPSTNVQLTIDVPSRPDIQALTLDLPVSVELNARRLSTYNGSGSSMIYTDLHLRMEIENGHLANNIPQRGYPGLTLARPFKIKGIYDQNGLEYKFRSINRAGAVCSNPPIPEDLEVEWRGLNVLISSNTSSQGSTRLTAKLNEEVYVTPSGLGPWQVYAVCNPGRNRFLDPAAIRFSRPATSTTSGWCRMEHALSGIGSNRVIVSTTFLIERAEVDLIDVNTNAEVTEAKPGMNVQIRLKDFSPYTGSPNPEPVKLSLEQSNGRQPIATSGFNGEWIWDYDLFSHSTSEFRSHTIWIAQGDSRIPQGVNLIHAILPLAHIVGSVYGLNFAVPTRGRRRHRRLIGDTEMMQESPVDTSEMGGVNDTVMLHCGEFVYSVCDISFRTRRDDISVCRTYRNQVVSQNPEYEPLGPGWFLDVDDLITIGGFTRFWESGRADDLFGMNHFGSIRPKGLFYNLRWNQTIGQNQSAIEIEKIHGDKIHFNTDGSIRFLEDRSGDRVSYVYDEKGRLERITDPIDPMNRYLQFHYNSSPNILLDGRLIKITDFASREIVFDYYQVSSPQGEVGYLKKVTYSPAPTLRVGVVDGNYRRSESYVYQNHPNYGWQLVKILNSDGEPKLVNHYNNGQIVKQEPKRDDTDQRSFDFDYSTDNETVVTDPSGDQVKLVYPVSPYWDKVCNKEYVEDLNGQNISTRMIFNHDGLMTELTTPRGEKTFLVYDKDNFNQRARSNILAMIVSPLLASGTTSQQNRITTYSYDISYNEVTGITSPEGNHPESDHKLYNSKLVYDTFGNLIDSYSPRVINGYRRPNGLLRWLHESPHSSFIYNPYQLIKKEISPTGIVTTFKYYPDNDPSGKNGSMPTEDGGGFLGAISIDTEVTPDRDSRIGDNIALDVRTTQFFYNDVGDTIKIIENLSTSRERIVEFEVNDLHEVNTISRATGSSESIVSNHYYNADFELSQSEVEQLGSANTAGGDKLITRYLRNRQGVLVGEEFRHWDPVTNQFKWIRSNVVLRNDDLISTIEPTFDSLLPDIKSIYDFDGRGLPKTISQGLIITQLKFDNNAQLEEVTFPLGIKTSIKYNSFGEQKATVDDRGNINDTESDSLGRSVRLFKQQGHNNNPTRVYPVPHLPYIHMEERKYNENGYNRRQYSLQSIIGSLPIQGNQVEPASDFIGGDLNPLPIIKTQQQDGLSLSGDGKSMTDVLTTAIGLPTRRINDEAGTEIYGYSPHDELIYVQSITGNDVSMTYDESGNLTEVEEKTAYKDVSGSIIRKSYFQKFEYDIHDRLTAITDNEGNTLRYEYDKTGFIKKSWDQMGTDSMVTYQGKSLNEPGNMNHYSRDALGRPVKIERALTANGIGGGPPEITPFNPTGKVIYEFEYYDDGGPLRAFIDHSKYHTEFEYHRNGLLKKVKHWLNSGGRMGPSHNTEYHYLQNSNQLDHSIDANGSTVQITYHPNHKSWIQKIESIISTSSSPNIRLEGAFNYSFKYDADGNIEELTDSTTGYSVLKSWDNDGRIIEEKQGTQLIKSKFIGNREHRLMYPGSSLSANYHFDRETRLQQIEDQGQIIARFSYKGDSRLLQRHYGGLTIDYEYDSAGRSKVISVQLGTTSVQFQIERDRLARIKNLKRVSGNITEISTWNYDSVGRITKETLDLGVGSTPLVTQRFYDGDSVLMKEEQDVIQGSGTISKVTDHDRGFKGQITSRNGIQFKYDNNGNLTDDDQKQYYYDPWNRLVRVESAGQTICKYEYDGFSRLIKRINGTDIEEYFYHDWDLIEIRDGASGLIKERIVYTTQKDDVISIEIGNERFRVLIGPNGSVDSIIDDNDQIVESYRYDLNGLVTVVDQNRQVVSTTPKSRILFKRRVYDSISGLYNFRMRWYHPEIGVFITPDPLGFEAGPNYYLLCNGDIINHNDPMGLDPGDDARDVMIRIANKNSHEKWLSEKAAELDVTPENLKAFLDDQYSKAMETHRRIKNRNTPKFVAYTREYEERVKAGLLRQKRADDILMAKHSFDAGLTFLALAAAKSRPRQGVQVKVLASRYTQRAQILETMSNQKTSFAQRSGSSKKNEAPNITYKRVKSKKGTTWVSTESEVKTMVAAGSNPATKDVRVTLDVGRRQGLIYGVNSSQNSASPFGLRYLPEGVSPSNTQNLRPALHGYPMQNLFGQNPQILTRVNNPQSSRGCAEVNAAFWAYVSGARGPGRAVLSASIPFCGAQNPPASNLNALKCVTTAPQWLRHLGYNPPAPPLQVGTSVVNASN